MRRILLTFLLATALGGLAGCLVTDVRADGGSPVGDAVSGVVSGAVQGGPIGAGIGGLIGFLSGLGLSLRERSKRKQAEGTATMLDKFAGQAVSGIGGFLDDALSEPEFQGLSGTEAYDLAKRKLRESLKARMDSASKALVEDLKATP